MDSVFEPTWECLAKEVENNIIYFASPFPDSGLKTQKENNKMPQRAGTEGGRMAVQSEGKETLTERDGRGGRDWVFMPREVEYCFQMFILPCDFLPVFFHNSETKHVHMTCLKL